MSGARAIARRTLADARIRTSAFGYLFAAVSYASVVGYRSAYPTRHDRLALTHAFAGNQAARLFYGEPRDLLTVGGFAAWRVAGLLCIVAAAAGLLAAVRALRDEEDAGRRELLLAAAVSRRAAYLAVLAAVAASTAALWLTGAIALVAAGLPIGGSAYLALASVAAAPVFVGVGALASQLAPTGRTATALSAGVLAAALLARVLADTVSGLTALRWVTPLGWVEELRPFAGARPAVLALPILATALLLLAAGSIARRRDIGTGILPQRDRAAPRLRLLASPAGQALRDERGRLIAWLLGTGACALIIGTASTSISSAGLTPSVQRQLHRVGAVTVTSPTGYVAFTFLLCVLALSLFGCSQVAGARRAEAAHQLETLLALPLTRRRWLAGRLVLAGAASVALALTAGLLAWAGAALQGSGVALQGTLEAGANCLPATLLFLGLGALAFAFVPRAAAGIAYGLVAAAFVWDLLGALLGVPRWLLDVTPFAQVALVPAQPFRATGAVTMLALALAAALAAAWRFARRDLVGA